MLLLTSTGECCLLLFYNNIIHRIAFNKFENKIILKINNTN